MQKISGSEFGRKVLVCALAVMILCFALPAWHPAQAKGTAAEEACKGVDVKTISIVGDRDRFRSRDCGGTYGYLGHQLACGNIQRKK